MSGRKVSFSLRTIIKASDGSLFPKDIVIAQQEGRSFAYSAKYNTERPNSPTDIPGNIRNTARIHLFGVCGGHQSCNGCIREILEGQEKIAFKKGSDGYQCLPEWEAVCQQHKDANERIEIRTCNACAIDDGVVLRLDRGANFLQPHVADTETENMNSK